MSKFFYYFSLVILYISVPLVLLWGYNQDKLWKESYTSFQQTPIYNSSWVLWQFWDLNFNWDNTIYIKEINPSMVGVYVYLCNMNGARINSASCEYALRRKLVVESTKTPTSGYTVLKDVTEY